MLIHRSPSPMPSETPVADLGQRNGEETSLAHLLQRPIAHRDVDQILKVARPEAKKEIFNSHAMKQYLGIATGPAPAKNESSGRSRIARNLWKRIGFMPPSSSPKPMRNDFGDHQRKPELLATAALNLESLDDAKRALKLLADYLKQGRNSDPRMADWARQYSQTTHGKSADQALSLLLENVAKVRAELRDDIMNIVLDNESFLGEKSAEKIDAALKQVDAAHARRVPLRSNSNGDRARIVRMSADTDAGQTSTVAVPDPQVSVATASPGEPSAASLLTAFSNTVPPIAESRSFGNDFAGHERSGTLSPIASRSSQTTASESAPVFTSASDDLKRPSTFMPSDAEEVIKSLSEDHVWDIKQFKDLRPLMRSFITNLRPSQYDLETSMQTFQSYIGFPPKKLTRIADIQVLDNAVEAFITRYETEVASNRDGLIEQKARHARLDARPSFVLAQDEAEKAQFDTARLKEFVRQTDRIRPFTQHAIDFWSSADVPVDGISGLEINYRDQHYSDSAKNIKVFNELFTEGKNAPLKIMPNEANLARANRSNQRKDNTCGIITLLQHATGDYDFKTHSAEASEIREMMEKQYPEVAEQTTLELDTSIPYMGWLLDEIERRHKKRLDPHVVQINSNGEPFIQKPVGESQGEKVVILNKGAHYEALLFNNDQIKPEDKQRLAFALVNGYTNRHLRKNHPFGEITNQGLPV